MLGVGIDWAEAFHDIALGTPEKGVVQQFPIEHSPAGVERLVTRCLALKGDPAEIRVVLETRRGGPARKKDDAEDARRPVGSSGIAGPRRPLRRRRDSWPRTCASVPTAFLRPSNPSPPVGVRVPEPRIAPLPASDLSSGQAEVLRAG